MKTATMTLATRFASTTALFAVAVLAAPARGQTARASVAVDGTEGNGLSQQPATAGDGQFLVFRSDADNLVANDRNFSADVFVLDRVAGTLERASVSSSGGEANDGSGNAVITPDGRYVAFASEASNLVAGDTNNQWDVFRHDRATGETIRISVSSSGKQGDGGSVTPGISADGRYVSFESIATNLVANDNNGRWDVFRHDCTTGRTLRVSIAAVGGDADGDSQTPSITRDGTQVAFWSHATNLIDPAPTVYAVYVRDIPNATTELVSVKDNGAFPNGDSLIPSISGDGRFVSYYSSATNLVAGDKNGLQDVFVRDRQLGHTVLASHTPAGAAGDGASTWSAISSDGSAVAFESLADDLVANDANQESDVFVCNLATGLVERASTHTGNFEAHGSSHWPALSDDGKAVFFSSDAADLVDDDTNAVVDVFSYRRETTPAEWHLYGDGWPGKFGVPSISLDDEPVLGTTRTLALGTSTDLWTFGFLLVGATESSLPTTLDGTLLLEPFDIVPMPAPPSGSRFTFDLPFDHRLTGVPFYFQWLEWDAAASKQASFSVGLEFAPGL